MPRRPHLPVLLCLAAPLLLVACYFEPLNCVSGKGEEVERTFALNDFESISLDVAARVFVTVDTTHQVVVRAQQNVIDELNLRVRGGELGIGRGRCINRSSGIEVLVTMPTVEGLTVNGSGEIRAETPFVSEELRLGVSGSGSIRVDTDALMISSNITGSGNIDLSGTADSHKIDISGSGSVRAFDLITARTEVRISGSGDADVNVSDLLEVDITGSGSVTYEGTPQVDSRVTGSGRVRRR
ncbi:MAG: head GIN domain-containing protein [Catalinimonas sp.]